MNEYIQYIKRIGIVGITNILISLSSLIFIPIITKNFSTADYGVWAQVNTVIVLIPNLVNLGLPFAMTRFLAAEKDKDKIKQSFYSMMALVFSVSILMMLIMFVFSNQIANALFDGSMQVTYIVAIISFFACTNLLLLSFFRTFQRIKTYSLFLVLQTYIGVGVSIVLTLAKYSIDVVILGLLTGYVITFIAMTVLVIKDLGFTTKLKNLKEELKLALPTVPNSISSWVVDSSDKFVISIFLGSATVGCYSPGYALGSILLMFLTPFSTLLPSVLPEYYESGDMEKVNTFLTYSMKYYLLITVPAAVGMSLLSKPLLYILTTDIIANQGYLVTPFVSLGAIFMGIYGISFNNILLDKKTDILAYTWIFIAILNIILNIITVQYLGIIGTALATLLCYFFACAVSLYYSNKFAVLPFDYKSIIKIIIATVVMGIFVKFFNPYGIFDILIVISVAVAIYFVVLFLIKGIDKKEIELIKEMI